jgi:exonuclease III
MGIDKHDKEGRLLTLEFKTFILISCYTPNAGDGLKRLSYRTEEWDKDFIEYVKNLRK